MQGTDLLPLRGGKRAIHAAATTQTVRAREASQLTPLPSSSGREKGEQVNTSHIPILPRIPRRPHAISTRTFESVCHLRRPCCLSWVGRAAAGRTGSENSRLSSSSLVHVVSTTPMRCYSRPPDPDFYCSQSQTPFYARLLPWLTLCGVVVGCSVE